MNLAIPQSYPTTFKTLSKALAEGLTNLGLRVWYDEFELRVGDSLRRSIDYGLSKSRFGAVVLSPSFFAKEWTKKELDALTAREINSKKIILPIHHNISVHEVRKHSPILADRYGINSVAGIDKTVEHLFLEISKHKLKKQRTKARSTEFFQISNEKLVEIRTALENIKRKLEVKELELKAVIAQADEVASTDELTFLPNRRRILADLKREILFSERFNAPLSIATVDIDHFKKINDTFGHFVGDEVLKEFAIVLREPVYHPNVIGRYGGEEFLLVMPHTTLNQARDEVEGLCKRIRSTQLIYDENIFHLTISVGIAQYKFQEEDFRGLFDRADKALYKAKKNGRDQWAIAD